MEKYMKTQASEILLVEDNPYDAELTLNALKINNLDSKVYWVENGEQALEFLYAGGEYSGRDINIKPKLILLDLKLPKEDGMEVLEKIKSDEKMKTIPIVILSSSREVSDIIKSYKLGVNSFVVKPVDSEEFLKSVSELGLYWLVLNQPPE